MTAKDILDYLTEAERQGQYKAAALEQEAATISGTIQDRARTLRSSLDALWWHLEAEYHAETAAAQTTRQLEDELTRVRAELSAKSNEAKAERRKRLEAERERMDSEESRLRTADRLDDMRAASLIIARQLDWANHGGYGTPVQFTSQYEQTAPAVRQLLKDLADRASEENTRELNRRAGHSHEYSRPPPPSGSQEHNRAEERRSRTTAEERFSFQQEMNAAAEIRIAALVQELREVKNELEQKQDALWCAKGRIMELLDTSREVEVKHAQDLDEARRRAEAAIEKMSRTLLDTKEGHVQEVVKLQDAGAVRTYEACWGILTARILSFDDIPWPMLDAPKSPEDISLVAVRRFLLPDSSTAFETKRAILKRALLRWHPDKFGSVLECVRESERDSVKRAVNLVAGYLNDLNQDG
ncbi:hypothetical protein PsYK624_163880 [Phanerochaete sordida]|uniref:J domain-containing protein n=1 Tax=Phanerochaete sordida TaxID=48140 RepID=A0A9P3LLU1_9APHY|nr:hypothetical protein PsYK624_163880 [Phanerochaete sordida]